MTIARIVPSSDPSSVSPAASSPRHRGWRARLVTSALAVAALGLAALAPSAVHAQTKWNPGFYMRLDTVGGTSMSSDPARKQALRDKIAQYDPNNEFKGVRIQTNWGDLEPAKATPPGTGSYNFAMIQDYLDVCNEYTPKKHLIVFVLERRIPAALPAWLDAEGEVFHGIKDNDPSKPFSIAMLWQGRAASTYFINLFKAFGAQFDSNPLFEAMYPEEAYIIVNPTPVAEGFTQDKRALHFRSLVQEFRASAPHTMIFSGVATWLGFADEDGPYTADIEAAGGGAFVPDSMKASPTWSNEVNYQIAHQGEHPFLGQGDTIFMPANATAQSYYDHVRNEMGCSHIGFVTGGDAWPTFWGPLKALAAADGWQSTHAERPPNLSTPINFAGSPTSSTAITLTWGDISSTETGFQIDRATNSTFTSGFVANAYQPAANATSVNATGLSPNTTYYFRIRAKFGTILSPNSAPTSATTFGGNLVANNGFESALGSEWTGPSSLSRVTSNAHSGVAALQASGTGNFGERIQNITATAGQHFTVSGWIKVNSVSGGNGFAVAYKWLNSSGGMISENYWNRTTTTSGYVQLPSSPTVITAPTGATKLQIRCVIRSTTGTAYFDDISVTSP